MKNNIVNIHIKVNNIDEVSTINQYGLAFDKGFATTMIFKYC
jgi:hypothetical protein